MSKTYSLFSYKPGSSFLHKCAPWIKILFIPIINILFLCLPIYFSLGLLIFQFVVACFLRFTLKEQLADLKPVLYYAFLLFFVQIITWFYSFDFSEKETFSDLGKSFLMNFSWESQKSSCFMILKLFAVMQSASLVFKTSTSLEMREGIEQIEIAVCKIFRKKSKLHFTNTISMFLNFIPLVAKIWEQSKKAWFARGGKNNVKMYMTLLPVLFSVGFKKAYNSARAISIRTAEENL